MASSWSRFLFVIPSEVEESLNCLLGIVMTKASTRIDNFIDGRFVEPISGRYLDNIEPATGERYYGRNKTEVKGDMSTLLVVANPAESARKIRREFFQWRLRIRPSPRS